MKTLIYFSFFTLLFSLTLNAQMISSNDRVRVEVRVITQSEHKDLAKTSTDEVTQHKTLSIILSGKSKSPETRVIKWTAYGRDMKSNNTRALESGEAKLELSSNGQQNIESKRVSTTYTPEHFTVSKSRSRGRSLPRATKVAAQGTKFIGYSAQVLDGGKVVGEVADPQGIMGAK